MQLFVGLFFFSMHLATGEEYQTGESIYPRHHIRECETCSGTGMNCSGPKVQCGISDKTCSFLWSDIKVGNVSNLTTVKRCFNQQPCFPDSFSVNMGQGRIARGKISCCFAVDTCEPSFPEFPKTHDIENAMQCPACYSLTGSCPEEVVACTGSAVRCLSLFFTTRMGETSYSFTMKGCTTDPVCDQLKEGYLQFGGPDVVIHNSECSQAPPSIGCSLLVLSGFLLMKILS